MDILDLKTSKPVDDPEATDTFQPVTVTLKITMPRVCMEAFLGFLRRLVECGNAGRSQWIGYYIDGQVNHPQIQASRTNVKCMEYTRSSFTCDTGFDYSN